MLIWLLKKMKNLIIFNLDQKLIKCVYYYAIITITCDLIGGQLDRYRVITKTLLSRLYNYI